jgi:hypothetical protein
MVLATGWLPKDAWPAYSPKGVRTLCFDGVLDDQADPETTAPWRFEIVDTAKQALYESRLIAGRAFIARGRLSAKPFVKDNRPQGFVRIVEVDALEFVRADNHAAKTTSESPS